MITAKEENRARKRDEGYQEGRGMSSGVMMLGSLVGKKPCWKSGPSKGRPVQMSGLGGMSCARGKT